MSMAPVEIDLDRFPTQARSTIHAAAYHANILGLDLTDREIIERAVKYLEDDAQKRDGYRGTKAASDAGKSRTIAADLRDRFL